MGEDDSDVETLLVLIRRMNGTRFKVKRYSAKGSAKLRRKCSAISSYWIAQSVTHIIICHDADTKNTQECNRLQNDLRNKVSAVPNCDDVVCIVIPVQELEAWLLADVEVLNNKFSGMAMRDIPNPERISSPKEYIRRASRGRRLRPRYFNTVHNPELASDLNIDKVLAKCPAFGPFYRFVSALC